MNRQRTIMALLLSVVVVASAPIPTAANEPADDELDPVLVSAKKIAEEPVHSRFAVPESSEAATQTFSKADIEAMHPKDVFEIIEQGLGMMTNFRGRKDLNNTQGRGGDSIGIILDGIYIPWSQSSRVLANFPVELIESVKIVRDSTVLTVGPLTSLASPLGSPNQGFIIIKTRNASARETEAKISYGTYNTQKYSLLHGDKTDDFCYNLAYTKARTDGKDGWYNASDSDSLFLKGGYASDQLTGNVSLYIDKASRQFQRGVYNNMPSDAKWQYDPLDTIMVAADVAKPWNARSTTTFSFGYSNVDADSIKDSFSNKSYAASEQKDYLREFNLAHTINTDNNLLKFGGQAVYWHSPTGGFYYEGIEREEELYGYYIYDEYRVNEKLTLDGGARMDRKHITKGINRYQATGNKGTDLINDQWANNATSYALGMSYKIDPVYKLSTRIAYSKQPTDAFLTTLDDKELDPEVRIKYETGLTAHYSKALNAALTLFYYDIDDCKIAVGTRKIGSDTVNVYDNHDVNRKGLELAFNGRLADALTYNLGYSYLTSNYAADNAGFPHNVYTLRLNNKHKDTETNVITRHVGGYKNYGQDLGGFTTVDASVSKNLDADATITLFGRNITNRHYATNYIISEKGTGTPEGYYYHVGATYGVEYSKKF